MKSVTDGLFTKLICGFALTAGSLMFGSAYAQAEPQMVISPEFVQAAKKEGDVTWYSVFDPDQMARVVDAFTSEYDIKVHIIRSAEGKLIQRYASELNANKVVADIVSVSNPLYYQAETENGTFRKFKAGDLPNLNAWPASAVHNDSTVLLSINPFVIAYNSDLLNDDEAPKTWEDLLDADLSGKMGAPNFAVAPTYVEFLNMWERTLGPDFLKKYKEQEKRHFDSSVPGNQALGAGEFAVFAPTMPVFAKPMMDKGAPIKLVFAPGTTGNPIYAAVSSDAPHPKAAQLFLNYLLSQAAQELLNKDVAATLLPNVEQSLKLPEGYQPPDSIAARDQADRLLNAVGLTN